jgi:hypothetical protein
MQIGLHNYKYLYPSYTYVYICILLMQSEWQGVADMGVVGIELRAG